jgi:hypothetical protein
MEQVLLFMGSSMKKPSNDDTGGHNEAVECMI